MSGNPYVGPRSIGGAQHPEEKIYGRTREIAELSDLLISERIVLLYSPSGSGKTSLLLAGLVPEMESRGFHVRPSLPISPLPENKKNEEKKRGGVIRVNAEPDRAPSLRGAPPPNRYVLSALLSLEEEQPPEQRTPLEKLRGMTLEDYLGNQANGEVLIFDQFEEVLTMDPLDRDAKAEFFGQLGDALADSGRWAIFSMREEFVAALDPYRHLVPTSLANTFRLDLLTTDNALEAVRLPAAAEQVEFTHDAARELLRNLSLVKVDVEGGQTMEVEGRYVEPVQLQVVCRRIWANRRQPGVIEKAEIGGASTVDEALGQYYEETVRDVARESGVPERALRDWFGKSLITQQTPQTRSQVSRGGDATRPVLAPPPNPDRALQLLTASHLIRSERRLNSLWYELAHDRLIQPVLNNNRKHVTDLQRRTELWKSTHSDGVLLDAREFPRLLRWRKEAVNQDERDFLHRSQWRLIGQAAGLGAVAVVLFFWWLTFQAERQATVLQAKAVQAQYEAEGAEGQAKQSAAQAQAELDRANREMKAHQEADAREQQARLAAQQSQLRESSAVIGETQALQMAASNSLATWAESRHNRSMDLTALLAVQAWNQLPASGYVKQTLFDTLRSTKRAIVMLHHDSQVNAIAWGPGRTLAAGSSDGAIWLWSPSSTGTFTSRKLAAHTGPVLSLAFSASGVLASGGADGVVRLWQNGSPLGEAVHAHQGRVNAVAFDAGGRLLASGGEDRTIRFWKTADPRSPAPASAPDGVPPPISTQSEITSLAISLQTHELVEAETSGMALLWDLSRGSPPSQLAAAGAETVGISNTGRTFVVKADDSVLVWDGGIGLSRPPVRYSDFHLDNRRLAAAIAPLAALTNGYDLVAVGGADRKIQIFPPHDAYRAATFLNGDARLFPDVHPWPPPPGAPILVMQGPENNIRKLAFSTDGAYLASLSDNDRSVWIFNIYQGGLLTAFPLAGLAGGPPQNLVIGPARQWLVTTSGPSGATLAAFRPASANAAPSAQTGLWQLAKSQLLPGTFVNDGPQADWRPVLAAGPDPKRPFLAVAEPTGKVSFRDPLTLAELGSIPRGTDQVASIALNHDGTLLAVTGWTADRRLRLYSLQDWTHPALLYQEDAQPAVMEGLAFSPKSNLLAVGAGTRLTGPSLDPAATRARLLDLRDPRHPRLVATLPKVNAHSLLFSPDGATLVTASTVIGLFDVPGGPPPPQPPELSPRAVLDATVGLVRHMAFTPDGGLLATGESADALPRPGAPIVGIRLHLWDPVHGVRFGDPLLMNLPASDVAAFEPGAPSALLIWTPTGILRMPLDPAAWARELCTRANRNMSLEEWTTYEGTFPYAKTCPNLPNGDGVK